MKKQSGEGPHIGDRIPYVIIQGTKGSKTYENAEDPIVVLTENKPIDYDYYINKQLRGPLERIFHHILRNTD
jgi:DNA polymerase delta subunit 1